MKDGKIVEHWIVEHWDVIQAVPETTANSNTMFYDKAHGDLYFDRDGSGDLVGRIKFASVDDNTTLNEPDFHIV